jgi:hypothetical protein
MMDEVRILRCSLTIRTYVFDASQHYASQYSAFLIIVVMVLMISIVSVVFTLCLMLYSVLC